MTPQSEACLCAMRLALAVAAAHDVADPALADDFGRFAALHLERALRFDQEAI